MKICRRVFIYILLIFILIATLPIKNVFAETLEPTLYSPSAILIDCFTGKILYEKDINKKMYPASLTKILTAIIVLEKCDLNEIATVSYDSVMTLDSGYVNANLQIGEELTIEQLLYTLLVASSNDAAIVLAEHISGSLEDFATLMNEKAIEIGCTNSNFVNPNGVHNENHYSTAYDLALIAKYSMKNETFRKVVSTTSYQLPATNKYESSDRVFTTTNDLIIVNNNKRADNYYYKYATGIKTGFTTPAGNCLIASASKDDLELISVVLGAGQTENFLSQRYLDTISLFEYGYNKYTIREVSKKASSVQTINVSNATRDTKRLDIVLENDISVLINKDNLNDVLLPQINLNEKIKAPLKKGDIVGTISYTVEGITYTSNIVASEDVKKSHTFLKFMIMITILVIYLLYVKVKKMRKRKNRRLKKR